MAPERASERPLLGRQAELVQLCGLAGIAQAGSGEPGAVLLSGDAGVGKTRLLIALRDRALELGWRVVAGHCLDFGDSALAYLPFSEMFGRLAAESPDLADELLAGQPSVARLMPGRRLMSDSHETAQPLDRGELLEAVHGALSWLSRDNPVLMIVEDVHWADPSTREMLTFLLARQPFGRVSVVASYRSDDLHRRHPLRSAVAEWARLPAVHRLALRPLGDDAVRELVRLIQPENLPDEDVCSIVTRAEGNAFFAEELVAASCTGELPTDLADLLLVRLDRLDDDARKVVRAAAVAGRRVSHDLLARVADLDAATLDRSLRSALDSNVLTPLGSDGYEFRHALLAEAVYDDLLPGERVRLHSAYAAALSAHDIEGTAAELVRHARAAHDVATAIRASIQAGDEAMAVGGPAEAARHYELALELLGDRAAPDRTGPVDVLALTVSASEAAAAAGDVFRGIALMQDLAARLPTDAPPARRAELLHALASVALQADSGIDVLKITTDAMRLVADGPPSPLRASVLNLHARANAEMLRDDEAVYWATEALAQARELGLPDVVTHATTTLARLADRSGDSAASRVDLESAIAEARRAGEVNAELRGLFSLGGVHYEHGRLAEARAAYTTAADRARELGRPWAPYGLDARAMAGIVAYTCGDWDLAVRLVDVSREQPPEFAEAVLVAVGLAVAAGRGEHAATALLADLRPWWDRDGLVAILSGGAAIDLYGDHGDLSAAIAVHADSTAHAADVWGSQTFTGHIRMSALLLGHLATTAGQAGTREHPALLARGDDLIQTAEAVAESRPGRGRPLGPEGQAWLARCRADHARLRWLSGVDPPDPEVLVSAWQAAVAGFEVFGHPFEAARSRARLAAALRASGHAAEAVEAADRAGEVAHRLGAQPLLAELRLGAVAPRRRAAPATTADQPALTAREQEVLHLVAAGLSNRDIGRRLFISAKTASVHVSNILAKLGATGRTEAVALAQRQGLLPLGGAPRSQTSRPAPLGVPGPGAPS